MLYIVDLPQTSGKARKSTRNKRRGLKSCIYLSLCSSCHVTLCIHKCVCVCLFSTGPCVFIFVVMYPLHVLCVSLSSLNKLPNPQQAPRLCPFGVCFSLLSFCLKPALSYHPRSLPRHHSFSPSLSLPLSPLVKCATSATLFCPSLGTLAGAGQ